MAYGPSRRKPAGRRRTYRRAAAKKGPSVTVKRRIPLAKRSTLMRLAKQVRYNTKQAQGRLQMSYQQLAWIAAPESEQYLDDIQCHLMLLPAIQAGSKVQSNALATATTITRTSPGSWREMVNPATTLNSLYAEFDQLLFWKNNLGVQANYVLYQSMYTFNFYAKSCTGWIQIDKLSYNRNYQGGGSAPNVTDYNLPSASIGLTHLCQGVNKQYRMNPFLFKRKRILRKYFNTTKPPSDGHFLGTNPNFSVNLKFKPPRGKKLIRLRQLDGSATAPALPTTDDKTISKGCQEWLLISCSLENADSTGDHHVRYDAYRTVVYRDMLGSVS